MENNNKVPYWWIEREERQKDKMFSLVTAAFCLGFWVAVLVMWMIKSFI